MQFITGARARWPGSTDATFALLPCGGDAVAEIPSQRWAVSRTPWPAGRYGSFISRAECFAGTFFGVSPAESSATDPQQRLLLEYGYSSLHAAHERRETLRGADIGVFLGIMNADFNAMFIENDSVYAATGGTISIAAGRLSFVLGTQGPCASYDTACSSALVAAHAAASAMRQHECISGLVLTVSLMLSPQVVIGSNANLTPRYLNDRADLWVSHCFCSPRHTTCTPVQACFQRTDVARHSMRVRTVTRVAKVLAHSLS